MGAVIGADDAPDGRAAQSVRQSAGLVAGSVLGGGTDGEKDCGNRGATKGEWWLSDCDVRFLVIEMLSDDPTPAVYTPSTSSPISHEKRHMLTLPDAACSISS